MNKNLKGSLFTKKALTPSEANVSKSIEGFLNSRKIYNDRLNSGKVEVRKKYFCKTLNRWKEFFNWLNLCKPGTPDRMAILPKKYDPRGIGGLLLYIEVKTLTGKLSPVQNFMHEELRKAGAMVLVIRSVTDLENCFREFEKFSLENQKQIHSLYDVSKYGNSSRE